ncbi:hypothetical protein F5Y02DRAFT_414036 [Annulohypoxylon stygium]|nr:hypothetical protein F5Y02DRAFT_414036 [Annulohypoxylon stygium]
MAGIVTYSPRTSYPPGSDIYGNPIPWHQRTHSPHYRPLASFSGSRPKGFTRTSLAYASSSGLPYSDPEEERKQAEWLEWQGRIATSPGTPLRPARPAPARPSGGRSWRSIGIYGIILPCLLRIHAVLIFWASFGPSIKQKCATKYAYYANALDRFYWLRLTAYRQSRWPATFREIRYWIKVLLIAMLAMAFVKLKYDEWRDAQPENPIVYRTGRPYIWSVTRKPEHYPHECRGHCFKPSHYNCDYLVWHDQIKQFIELGEIF